MRRWLICSVALALLSPAFPAYSQELSEQQESEFKRLTGEAGALYEAGSFEPAASKFLEAYAIKPVSNILYNVGRIYEQAGKLELALEHFEKFVKAPNVEQEARRDAIDRIKTIREVLALDAEPANTSQQTQAQDTTPTTTETAPAPVAKPDHTVAWIFLGAGGVTLATSGVMAFLASGANDDFENATSVQERRDAADSGETYSLVADTLLITGAVLTGVGAVLYFTAGSGEEQTTMTIGPRFDAHSVGLGLEMNY